MCISAMQCHMTDGMDSRDLRNKPRRSYKAKKGQTTDMDNNMYILYICLRIKSTVDTMCAICIQCYIFIVTVTLAVPFQLSCLRPFLLPLFPHSAFPPLLIFSFESFPPFLSSSFPNIPHSLFHPFLFLFSSFLLSSFLNSFFPLSFFFHFFPPFFACPPFLLS